MNSTEDVTIEIANDGIIVRSPSSAKGETESYIIRNAGLYTDRTGRWVVPIQWSHLWLIWFGSLPLLAAIIYALIHFFGQS
jgi:hypothetical protein